MSKLLCRPHDPDQNGLTMSISPETAGWKYVGFEVYHLSPGQTLEKPTGAMEVCLVLLSGKADVSSCLLYTSPSPRDLSTSRMPSSA